VGSDSRNLAIPSGMVDIWQQVVDSVANLLSVPSVMINRVEPPELQVFRSNASSTNPFPTGTRMALAGIYCETAARQREKVRVVDARNDPLWAGSPTAKAGIFAYLGYPLLWPDGEVFGTICAIDTKENRWEGESESILHAFKNAIEMHLTLVCTLQALEKRNQELWQTIGDVKTLRGLLPICASCKKIRDDKGYWQQIEDYIERHSEAGFSHSVCPECAKSLYPGIDHDGAAL
jgi:GAF domain-containing protein